METCYGSPESCAAGVLRCNVTALARGWGRLRVPPEAAGRRAPSRLLARGKCRFSPPHGSAWLEGITDSMDINLSKLREMVKGGEA